MTTDERIDRLVERHEALAESVQSLLATSTETDRRLLETDRRLRETQQIIVSVARDLEGFAAEMRESVLGLVGAIRNHEGRIQSLETRL